MRYVRLRKPPRLPPWDPYFLGLLPLYNTDTSTFVFPAQTSFRLNISTWMYINISNIKLVIPKNLLLLGVLHLTSPPLKAEAQGPHIWFSLFHATKHTRSISKSFQLPLQHISRIWLLLKTSSSTSLSLPNPECSIRPWIWAAFSLSHQAMSPTADHTAAFHVIRSHTGPSADSQHTTRMALFKLKSEPSILPRRARPWPLVPTSHHGSDAGLLADSPRLQCHLPSHNPLHLPFPHLCSLLGYKLLSIWLTVTSLGLVWDRHPIIIATAAWADRGADHVCTATGDPEGPTHNPLPSWVWF